MSEYDDLLARVRSAPAPLDKRKPLDEYSTLLNRAREDQVTISESSLNASTFTNPEVEGEKIRLSRDLKAYFNEDWAPASIDISEAKRRLVQARGASAIQESTALMQSMQNSDFAKVAHDQAEPLTAVDKTTRVLGAFTSGVTSTLVGGGIEGIGYLADAAWRKSLGAIAKIVLPKPREGMEPTPESLAPPGLGEGWIEAGKAIQAVSKKYIEPEGPLTKVEQVAQGLGQAGGQLGLFFVPGGQAASVGLMFGQGAKIAREKIDLSPIALDAPVTDQDWQVLTGGAITGATEWITSKLMLKTPQIFALKSKLLDYAAKVALGATEEGIQEYTENILHDLNAIAFTDPESSIKWSEAADSAEIGAYVGGIVQAVINAGLHIRARGQQKAFEDLNDAAKAQKLRERSPETYQNYADAVAAHLARTSDGAVTDVYIESDVFRQTLVNAGINPESVGEAMPTIGKQLEAAVNGDDIVIPMGEWVGKIAGTDIGSMLSPHVRANTDALSIAELEQIQKSQATLKESAAKIIAEKEQTDAFITSAREVETNIFEQLKATKVYPDSVSRVNASMVRDMYVVKAAEMGITPSQLYAQVPYKVEVGAGVTPEGGLLTQQELDTTTPEFQRWWGRSMASDAEGKPITLYRGMAGENLPDDGVSVMEPESGLLGMGIYMTGFPGRAAGYARGERGQIYPLYASIQNPISEDEFIERFGRTKRTAQENLAITDQLISEGYDGIIAKHGDGKTWEVVAFRPEQVKSVFNIAPTGDPDILKQAAAEDKAWRNWEPEITRTGKIKGSPEWVNNQDDLKKMRKELRKYVNEGLTGRYWYEKSAQAVMDLVGGDAVLAEKFIQLLAIYSPNSNVWVNTIQAVKAYTHWRLGRAPEKFSVGSGNHDIKAIDVLYNNINWEGRKTNSFYLNLMHDIVERYPDQVSKLNLDPSFVTDLNKPVTIDVWMARAFGYEVEAFRDDKGTGKYSFSENELRRLTARLNDGLADGEERWTPHQVQAAIWTAMKTRYEFADVKAKTNAKSLREGLIVVEDGGVVYPKTPETRRKHLANWRHFAMQKTTDEVIKSAEENARSFGDDLQRMTEVVTWEANPSTALGYEINKASAAVMRMFTAEAKGLLLDENGNDMLAAMLGVAMSYSTEGYGAYASALSPNNLSHLLPMRKTGVEGFSVDEVRAYAQAIQYIFKQDAVPWFRPDNKPLTAASAIDGQKFRVINTKTGRTAPGGKFDTQADAEAFAKKKGDGFEVRGGDLARAAVIRFSSALTPSKLGDILSTLQRYLGKDAGYTRTAEDEITIVNFRDDDTKIPLARTDEDFVDAIGKFFKQDGQALGITEHGVIWSQGEYGNVHDWSKDGEGKSLLGTGAISGRPDIHAWLRSRRDAFDALLEKYSGQNLADLEQTTAESGILYQSGTGGLGGIQPLRAADLGIRQKYGVAREGSTSVTGVHYSRQPRDTLNGFYYGTGLKGAESKRLAGAEDSRLNQRVHFYVDEGNGIRPEAGVGQNVHGVILDNLYDVNVDPLNLRKQASEAGVDDSGLWFNAVESEIINAGFDGVYVPGAQGAQGVAVLLGSHSVPVEKKGTHSMAGAGARVGAPTGQRKYALLSSEIRKFEAEQAEIEEATPSVKLKDGNLIFDDADIDAVAGFFPGAARAGQILRQEARGGFDPKRLTTLLNEKADFSTFAHETSHFYVEMLFRMATMPQATPQIKADAATLLEFFGVPDIDTWNNLSVNDKRKAHESFAYNYEIYLFEGKAPSIKQQSMFDKFSAWLRRIYKSIRDDLNASYRAENGVDLPLLTGEVRQVMDRMLASDEQIRQAEQMRSMMPLYQNQEQSGMSDPEWAAYQEMVKEAHDASVTDLTQASMRQMKWLSNARSRILKDIQKTSDTIRKEVAKQASDEIKSMPVYRAMEFLKKGILDGSPVDNPVKLSIAEIEAMYADSPILGLIKDSLGFGKYGMLATENAIHPEQAAEMLGFESGDAMIRALLEAKPLKEAITELTDQRMLEEFGDMSDAKGIDMAVEVALHNEARARFVAVELRHMAKATQPVRLMLQAAKQVAKGIISGKKISEIKPRDFSLAEARAARQATDLMKKGQSQEAAKAKQNQLVQNQLATEAVAARQEVKKAVEGFRKFFKSNERLAKTRNMDLVDAARSVLAYYGLGQKGKSPVEYIEKLRAYNPELYAEMEPLIIDAATGAKQYTDLTMDEFRTLRDTVEALWFQAKRENEVMIEGKAVALDEIVGELNTRLEAIGIPEEVAGERGAPSTKDRVVRQFYAGKAITRRVEHWADATDGPGGPGPFTKYIWRPIRSALDAYRTDRNKYVKRYVELIEGLDLPVGKIAAPELNYTFGDGNGGIGKAELIGAILHTGNESNLKKLLLGRGWATQREDGSIDTTAWDAFQKRMIDEGKLTKADYDFAQAVWDLNEELKPMAQEAHKDILGYYFKEVAATPVVTPFGTYRGGYVPAKTDPFIVRDAQRQAKMEELESDFRQSMPSTGMGFTKGRVEYNKPLSLDVRLGAKHIDDVIRFANVQPAIKDALKILRKRDFADSLTRIDPTVIEDMLIPWLNRTARQITSEPGKFKALDAFWSGVRTRTGISIMFANITNAMQQLTGYFPAMLKVRPTYLKSALFEYMGNAQKVTEEVSELSQFMADRLHNQVFDMQDAMNQMVLNPSRFDKVQAWAKHHGYFLQTAFQNQVDVVTWTGAFNQSLAESGKDKSDSSALKEAVHKADAAVRLTQSSLTPEDVAGFEVGTPFYKTLIQFSGYFNMLANLNSTEYIKVFRDMGWRGNKGKLGMIYMLGFAAPMLVSDAIVRSLGGAWDDEDDDGYLDEFAEWFFGSQAKGVAALVPFGTAAVTALTTAFNNKPYDDRMTTSPSVSTLEAATIGVGKTVLNVIDEDKEVTGRNVRDVLTLLSLATGIPITVLGRPVGYAIDVERGKIEPTSKADYLRGLVTGKASELSRQ